MGNRTKMAVLATICAAFSGPAAADSCWTHNGSLMRLGANGAQRAFAYEVPRPALVRLGVARGLTAFYGETDGRFYRGEAKLFSAECPGAQYGYRVEGPISADQTRIVLSGERPVLRGCAPSGETKRERLVFVYARQC
jgi:hypothetical protein